MRALDTCDAEAFAALLQDRRVTRFLPSAPAACSVAEASHCIALAGRAMERGSHWHWALLLQGEARMIGELTLDRHSAEVGLWLGADHWQQGFAGEALQTLMVRARPLCGLDSLRAMIVRGNFAACRVFERLGFEFAGSSLERLGRNRPTWLHYRCRHLPSA